MSMALNNTMPTTQQHVPAWKRIGLKLKYAKDTSGDLSPPRNQFETTAVEPTGASNGSKEIVQYSTNDVRPAKRRRKSSETTTPSRDPGPNVSPAVGSYEPKVRRTSSGPDPTVLSTEEDLGRSKHELSPSSHRRTISSPRSTNSEVEAAALKPRKKSVTFAPETKPDKSYGTTELIARGKDSQHFGGLAANSVEDSTPSSTQSQKASKRAKVKRSATNASSGHSSVKSVANGEPKGSPGYVLYLERFYADKPSWKFNKGNQKGLLKNLVNVHRIPPGHNSAILEYISGLQGVAARQRLVESAEAVLKAIAEREDDIELDSMESEIARRAAYAAALKRQIERYERSGSIGSEYDGAQLVEMKDELEQGQRAEAILAQLLQQELDPAQHTAADPAQAPIHDVKPDADTSTNNGDAPTMKSTKRKRKSRTQVSSDESSNESSESSESEGDLHSTRRPATMHDALSARSDAKPKLRDGKSLLPSSTSKPNSKIIFDDDLLDQVFPKSEKHRVAKSKPKLEKKSYFRQT